MFFIDTLLKNTECLKFFFHLNRVLEAFLNVFTNKFKQ
jgi:hypothetical protein